MEISRKFYFNSDANAILVLTTQIFFIATIITDRNVTDSFFPPRSEGRMKAEIIIAAFDERTATLLVVFVVCSLKAFESRCFPLITLKLPISSPRKLLTILLF
jgi:hypothetical protein